MFSLTDNYELFKVQYLVFLIWKATVSLNNSPCVSVVDIIVKLIPHHRYNHCPVSSMNRGFSQGSHIINVSNLSQKKHLCDYSAFLFLPAWLQPLQCAAKICSNLLNLILNSRSWRFQRYQTCQAELQCAQWSTNSILAAVYTFVVAHLMHPHSGF